MRRSHLAAVIGCAFLVPYSILLCGGRSLLAERVAALEAEVAELRAQLEGNRNLRVFDADGNVLGIPWYGQGRVSPEEFIFIEELNLSWNLFAALGYSHYDEIYFELPDCQGNGYTRQDWLLYPAAHLLGPVNRGNGDEFFTVGTAMEPGPIVASSYLISEECSNSPTPITLEAPIRAVPLAEPLPFPLPVRRPLRVGLATAPAAAGEGGE